MISSIRKHRVGLSLIFICTAISVFWGLTAGRSMPGGMADFKAVYYGARCLIHGSDPYNPREFLRVYVANGGQFPTDPVLARRFFRAVPVCINLPTTLFLTVPLAYFDWRTAHFVWMTLMAVGLIAAAVLVWQTCAQDMPVASLVLICFMLANGEVLFMLGNTAGIAVSLCIIAAWCFINERFALVGVLCLAISLAIKPHDGGLVWLYFLLAGGIRSKHALQTLILTLVLCIPGILWVSHVSPHWMQELHANLAASSVHGDLNDPGPSSVTGNTINMVVNLQAALSVLWDNPRFYNLTSYFICGIMLVLWSISTLRSRFSVTKAWFALAAIAPITLLATYHRPYDARLLLLSLPACSMLWARGRSISRIAALLTTAGVVLTADIPLVISIILYRKLLPSTAGILKIILTLLLARPASLILLAMAVFYLWAYWNCAPHSAETKA